MDLDVAALRSHFPSLESGIAHFDGPGGTQSPRAVGRAIAGTLTGPLSNRGSGIPSEQNAEDAVAGFRSAYADLLGIGPDGIVYGRSATQLTYDFSRHLAKAWAPGDEVVVSRLDHDSNIRPWLQIAERTGLAVRWWEFEVGTAEPDLAEMAGLLSERTRLVAVTGASNLLGTRPDLARIGRLVHDAGALLYVDGVHLAAHEAIDVPALGADFFVCSPYKFFGPHCAVLAAEPELLAGIHPDKLLASTDTVPERFEFGTLPYEIMAGATAAVDFLADLGGAADIATSRHANTRRHRLATAFEAIDAHEQRLRARIEEQLRDWERVRVHSNAAHRTPTLLFTIDGLASDEVYRALAARGVLAPAGSFYAYDAFQRLDCGDRAAVRVGLAPYNDDGDVDRLLVGLAELLAADR